MEIVNKKIDSTFKWIGYLLLALVMFVTVTTGLAEAGYPSYITYTFSGTTAAIFLILADLILTISKAISDKLNEIIDLSRTKKEKKKQSVASATVLVSLVTINSLLMMKVIDLVVGDSNEEIAIIGQILVGVLILKTVLQYIFDMLDRYIDYKKVSENNDRTSEQTTGSDNVLAHGNNEAKL